MACAYRYPFGAWRALIGIFLPHDMRISVSGTGSCEKFANGFPLGIGMSHFWSWHRNESPEIARKQIVMHMVRDSVTAIPVAMDAFAPALGDGVGGGRECGCLPGARPRRGSCRPARPLRLGGRGKWGGGHAATSSSVPAGDFAQTWGLQRAKLRNARGGHLASPPSPSG